MAPSFGTSGLRGLVTDLTPELVADYVRAFLSVCPHGGTVYVGHDLRPSSPEIASHVIDAVRGCGINAVDCGAVPTPALAMASIDAGAAAVMVTGSHIPADRNGLKFYVPTGEVSKEDEAAIVAAYDARKSPDGRDGALAQETDLSARYVARYRDAFGPDALSGLTIGIYEHSSVARDIMVEVVEALGATAVRFARSDTFVPVDTEAVDPETRTMLHGWCRENGLDAVISTDGDADRPMLTTADGDVVPGDILGVLTARHLGARIICTPVSSNDMVRRIADFTTVHLTRIGSPFVIAAMEEVMTTSDALVAGFEANGGFLLGFTATASGPLAPLMTRDSILPIVTPLVAAKQAGLSLAELTASLPPCFTAADRVQEIDRSKAATFLTSMTEDVAAREAFFVRSGPIESVDLTDGLRINFQSGEVVHLRPSGNAPEFRIYAQADNPEAANALVRTYMDEVAFCVK